jgi:uncharacterized protein (DUF433 family)
MKQIQNLNRITVDPEVMGGKPCIRGMRVTVSCIIRQLAGGESVQRILAAYPYLESEDIHQALAFSAWLTDAHELDITPFADQELAFA